MTTPTAKEDMTKFFMKCEWEGGLCEALFGYGLKLPDSVPDYLKVQLEELHDAMDAFEESLDAYSEQLGIDRDELEC